jgi:hypothetical protein
MKQGGLAAAARRREAAAPQPAEPPDSWALVGTLQRQRTEALAEREALTARIGTLVLAAAGGDRNAGAEMIRVRTRLAALAGAEQETAAGLAVAEAQRQKVNAAESIARRQRARDRCAELADDRREIAGEIDRLLGEINVMIRGYLAAGQMVTGALRAGGARVEAGPSDPVDGIRICDAIVRTAPALARMLRERGFSPSVIPADARPMLVHEAIVQHRVSSALEQAARHDLSEIQEAA